MGKKIVLLDIDGTIMDSSFGIVISMDYALKKNGITLPPEVIDTFVGPPFVESLGKHNIPTKIRNSIILDYHDKYTNSINGELPGNKVAKEFVGILDLVKKFRSRGYKVVTASTKEIGGARKMFEHFNITEYFDGIFASDYKRNILTKEKVIKEALEFLDYDKKNDKAVMVGDKEFDIIGGKAHNLYSIGVTWGYAINNELEKSNPDRIVNTVKELGQVITNYFDDEEN